MLEFFDMLFRFAFLPMLGFLLFVTLVGIVHDIVTGANLKVNIEDILGPEADGKGDIDPEELM